MKNKELLQVHEYMDKHTYIKLIEFQYDSMDYILYRCQCGSYRYTYKWNMSKKLLLLTACGPSLLDKMIKTIRREHFMEFKDFLVDIGAHTWEWHDHREFE